ncbi:hypothetical protein BKA60DRAFT_536510 [Fusarium oxysporum]|nr:hypothetical protein BKA60DRAFT_536510 [Fusarium oxysporum]
MPFHERTRNSSVAGRQQDQCPRARGGWEKVISYLIWPRQCITRLICWLTGASLRADQPGKYGLTRWKTFLVKFWLHGYHFVQTATTWLDCVIRVENGYSIPPISHFDDNAPILSSSPMLSTPVYLSPDEATPLTVDTVRWPFLSSSSESDEEPDDESGMGMEAVTSIAKLPGFLLPSSSEPNDNSDEKLHGRIRAVALMARVFKNPRRVLPTVAGGFCEAL